MKVAKLCTSLRADELQVPVVGWVGDEMEIRSGLIYIKETGCIVGRTTGPIAEKDIDTINEAEVLSTLATKILMIHITTIDGRANVPFMYFPTNKITAEFITKKVNLHQSAKLIPVTDFTASEIDARE